MYTYIYIAMAALGRLLQLSGNQASFIGSTLNMYIYIYMCVSVCIDRERDRTVEREREKEREGDEYDAMAALGRLLQLSGNQAMH